MVNRWRVIVAIGRECGCGGASFLPGIKIKNGLTCACARFTLAS
jgi:hypothetical protein